MTQNKTAQWRILCFNGYNAENIIKIAEDLSSMFGADNVFCPTCIEKVLNKKTQKYMHTAIPTYGSYIFIRLADMREAGSKISKKYSRYYFVTSPNNNECAIVTEQEINIMRKVDASLVYTMYRAGDIVVINAGPFKNFTGTISLVDEEKKTLDVDVDVFEKKVTVNRTYDQVELA